METKFRAKVDLHVPPQISAQALAMALHMKAKSMPAYFEGFSPEAIVAMTQAPSYPSQVHPVMMKSRPQEIRSQVRLPEIPPYYMDKLDTYPMTHPNQQLQRMQNDEYSQSNNSVPVTVNGPFQNEKQGKIGLLNPISQASAFRSLGAQESQSQEKFAQWFLPKQPSTESQNLLSRDAAPRNRFVEMWNRDLVKFNPDSLTSVTEQLLNRSKNSIDGTSSSSSVNQNDLDASDLLLNFFKAANGNDSEVEAALKRNGLENIRENREALSSFYQNIEIPIKQSSGEISSGNNSSLTSGEDNSNSTGSEKNSNESDDVDSSSDSGKNSTTSKYDENSGADKDLDTITTISKLSKESRDRKKEKKLRKYTSENHYNTKSRKEIDKETQQIGAEHSKYYGLNSYSNTNANKKRANQLSNQDFEKETESKRIKLD